MMYPFRSDFNQTRKLNNDMAFANNVDTDCSLLNNESFGLSLLVISSCLTHREFTNFERH